MKATPSRKGGGKATDAARVRGGLAAAALGFSLILLSAAGSIAAPAATGGAAAAAAVTATPDNGGRASDQGISVEAKVLPVGTGAGAGGGGALVEGAEALFRFHLADASGAPVAGAYPAAWMDRVAPAQGGAPPTACEARIKELVEGSLFSQAALDLNVYYVITLNDDASLSVVDPLFGYGGTKLLAMVPLASPGEDWALDDGIRKLFVALPAAGEIAVVDTTTFKVTAHLPASSPRPTRIALQPDAGYLWVASEGAVPPAAAAKSGSAHSAANAKSANAELEAAAKSGSAQSAAATNGRAQLAPDGGSTSTRAPALAPAGGGGSLDAFDPRTLARVAHFAVGAGVHDLAVSDDSRFVFVANRDAGSVTVVDVTRLAVAATVATGGRPVSIAWSRQAQLAYVSDAEGAVVALAAPDPRHPEVPAIRARIAAEPGLGAIAFPPDGRFGFVVNPTTDRVHILDTANNRIVQTAHVESAPDQVDFSAELAYVHHLRSETVLTIPLKSIGQPGAPVTVMDVPAGQHSLGAGSRPSPAAPIVRAPGANAVLIANPADAAVYYYQEGMAAPMGSFHDFERQPRAVLVLDRTLKESAPGVYTTTAKLPAGGRFRLALFLDTPRIVHCFDVDVAPDPVLAAQRLAALPPRVTYLADHRSTPASHPFPLRFRLTHPVTGAPLAGHTDVEVLYFLPPGNDRRTLPAHEIEPGLYAADLPLTLPGTYSIYVQSSTLKLPFHSSPRLLVEATADTPGPAAHP